ncbi:hypothetical protein FXB42_07005 [Acetobacterium wieringae]|uniref:Uncharacterized protein n=1 Tax=Acetobacterium wieringae TaxID=52694 RepID=A0A5D0WMW7_9FIRM|nr:hypothetical protein [Acetobacterium wieringae]TYC85625.1 hypothetical protein FXB42_07005 [Acetobacterium wieringae]
MDKRRKIIILGISLFVIIIILTVGVITERIADKNAENNGLISIPFSSLDLEKENYAKIVKQLEDAGFVNVVTLKIEDLSLGIITKDGEVESLTIDGEDNFSNGDRFDKNAKITVSYHTFPEKNESAIEAPETEVPKTEAPKEVAVEDYTEANRLINETLLLSQGWALGKLDENGNPTENGTPNAAFAFSLYVYNIEYLGDKLRITVDPSFMQLSDAEKTAIANDVQGSVYSLTNNRPYTTFFVNGNAIGNSKITDAQSFKWD